MKIEESKMKHSFNSPFSHHLKLNSLTIVGTAGIIIEVDMVATVVVAGTIKDTTTTTITITTISIDGDFIFYFLKQQLKG